MNFLVFVLLIGFNNQAAVQDPPAWETTQYKDPFLGAEYTEFRLTGKYLAAPKDASSTPSMILRCKPGPHNFGKYDGKLAEAFLFVGQAVVDSHVSYDSSSRVTTQYRLDDSKVHTEYLSHSTDFKAISLMPRMCGECVVNDFFYAHQISHKEGTSQQVKKVVVSIPEYLGGDVVIQFDLPDVTQVAKVCGVSYHK